MMPAGPLSLALATSEAADDVLGDADAVVPPDVELLRVTSSVATTVRTTTTSTARPPRIHFVRFPGGVGGGEDHCGGGAPGAGNAPGPGGGIVMRAHPDGDASPVTSR
jgi:hypothetical protein